MIGSRSRIDGQPREHEYYFELCALTTAGTLTDREWADLRSHLGECDSCAELVQEFRELARSGVPVLMPDVPRDDGSLPRSWSPDMAKRELYARVQRGESTGQRHGRAQGKQAVTHRMWQRLAVHNPHVVFRYAAALVVTAAATLVAYQAGVGRGREEPARVVADSSAAELGSLRSRLRELSQERDSLNERANRQSQAIADVAKQLKSRQAELAKWRELRSEGERGLQQRSAQIAELRSANSAGAAEREMISRALQETKTALVAAQNRLEALREQHASDLLRSASLEIRIEEVSERLRESDEIARQQQQFLAYDRDIRELMGARDLYIADVFDVDREGRTQKPFGRVFYTRGKNLIFYAFDLNLEEGARTASTFQAWGRRGLKDKRPLNMGVFYLDNQTNRRWILRFDVPKLLAQIDAVFVTVEPLGGSERPSGKQLLFASLRTPANHP